MPLEAASAVITLPSAWVEWSNVSITAGSLPDISACIDVIEQKMNRGVISVATRPSCSDIAKFINRAKEEVVEVKGYTWARRYVTGTLTAGTWRYALPPDCHKILFLHDLTNDKEIVVVDNNTFDVAYPDVAEETNGSIYLATQKNLELWVGPAPDGSDIVEMEYERNGDDLTTIDVSWLPEIERWRCLDFAQAEAWEDLNQYDRAQYFRRKWTEGLGKGKRSDNRRKYKGMQARGLFG